MFEQRILVKRSDKVRNISYSEKSNFLKLGFFLLRSKKELEGEIYGC